MQFKKKSSFKRQKSLFGQACSSFESSKAQKESRWSSSYFQKQIKLRHVQLSFSFKQGQFLHNVNNYRNEKEERKEERYFDKKRQRRVDSWRRISFSIYGRLEVQSLRKYQKYKTFCSAFDLHELDWWGRINESYSTLVYWCNDWAKSQIIC